MTIVNNNIPHGVDLEHSKVSRIGTNMSTRHKKMNSDMRNYSNKKRAIIQDSDGKKQLKKIYFIKESQITKDNEDEANKNEENLMIRGNRSVMINKVTKINNQKEEKHVSFSRINHLDESQNNGDEINLTENLDEDRSNNFAVENGQ